MNPRRLAATLVISVAVIAACDDDTTPERTEATARDSAGVTIIQHTAPPAGPGLRVTADPALEIGMAEGPEAYQLDGVRGAVRLSDGTIAVADGGSRRIRLYDADGRHLRDLGGQGDGPGEFQNLGAVHPDPAGSGLIGWDGSTKRYTHFTAEGVVGTIHGLDDIDGFIATSHGVLEDGTFVLSPGESVAELAAAEPGTRRPERPVLRFAETSGVDTLARVPRRETEVYREEGRFGNRTMLFRRDSYIVAGGERVHVLDNDRPELRSYDSEGRLHRIVRLPVELRRVTEEELTERRERAEESALASARRLAEMTGSPIPEPPTFRHRDTHPLAYALLADADGRLWIRLDDSEDADAPVRWWIVDAGGMELREVSLLAGVEPLHADGDVLIARVRDDLEVEYVHLYALGVTDDD